MSGYSVFKADVKKNKKEILDLLIENLDDQSEPRYEWNYENCPFGLAPVWLAKHEETDTMVGTAALYPRKLIINGNEVIAAIAGGFGVNKKHRVFGPAIQLQKELQSGLEGTGIKFIYESPNEISRMIFLRIGYKKIAELKKFIKIIKTEQLPKDYITRTMSSPMKKEVFKFIFNTKTLLKILDFFLAVKSKEKRYRKKLSYSVEIPDRFDKRFDEFWGKVSKQYEIIGERKSKYLNWRFIESPHQEHKIFCLIDDNNKILGYIVYYVFKNKYNIMDLMYIDQTNVLDALLAEFSLYGRKTKIGAIVIHYLGDTQIPNKLKEFNFWYKKVENEEILIYCSDPSFEENLLIENKWHFLVGDVDI